MKRILIVVLLASAMAIPALAAPTWWVNPWMSMLWERDRPLYYLFLAAGAQTVVCIDWDAQGRVIPAVCVDPPPPPVDPGK